MEPQYLIETKGYEFRYQYSMPHEFRDRVCVCEQYKWNTDDFINRRDTRVSKCLSCGKPSLWTLCKCVYCDKIFLRDFVSKYRCSFCASCYDCTQKYEEGWCEIHPPIINKWENGTPNKVIEPLGWNPREFTAEEMANVFDFE